MDKLLLREKMGGFRTKAVATVLLQLLFVQTSLAAANSSCAEALHTFLAKVFQILYFLDFQLRQVYLECATIYIGPQTNIAHFSIFFPQ